MKREKPRPGDWLFTALALAGAFGVNLLLKARFATVTMIPVIFVLGVFLVARRTRGYLCGIVASLVGVLAMNYAFTHPYYAFDLISPESVSSAAVMLAVSVMTSTLTTQIKEQDRVKAEAEKERLRGDLLRGVSHDLRTPLTGIYGACATLRENYDSLSRSQHMKLLEDIQGDARWLVRMVENLLSITRLDGGPVTLTRQETVVEELVDDALVSFRKHYPRQPVQARVPETFVTVPMDAMLIRQVLLNLLENAAIHGGSPTLLELSVEVEKGRAVFRVRDNGRGIPQEKLATLFSGVQSAGRPDGGARGMGIGLSVCAAIIKAHGGTIQGGNLPEGGAEFVFTLDMEEDDRGE